VLVVGVRHLGSRDDVAELSREGCNLLLGPAELSNERSANRLPLDVGELSHPPCLHLHCETG
jgi:hypothetical protein